MLNLYGAAELASLGQTASSVTLAWNPDSSANVVSYNVYSGGASQSYTNVVSAGNATNKSVTGLASGSTYFFAVTAVDSAGLESQPSSEISYTVPSGNTNLTPTVALAAPASGANYLAPASINLQASVTSNGHTITQVQFYNGAALLGAASASPYSFLWNSVAAGTYSLTAKVVYDAGSTVASAPVTVTVTNAPSGQTPSSVTLAWNPDSSANIVTYNVYSGGASQSYTNVVSAGNATNKTVTGLASGSTYFFAVTAVDSAGLESQPSSEISYTMSGNTTLAPTVALAAPASGASYLAPASINLQASVTSNGHTITQVQFYNGAALLGTASASPYNFLWNSVAAGSYSLTAQVVYDAGSAVSSAPAAVTVTNALPPPAIVLAAPANGSSYAAPASINLQASVTSNGHTITQVKFFSGSNLLGSSSSVPYNFLWTNVAAGTYSLTALAVYDSGSNVGSAPATVTVTGLPAPWQNMDIGSTGIGGSAVISNGLYTLAGAGNISGSSDNFQFLYQTLSGDGQILGQITSVQGSGGGTGGIGAMIRETLTSGSSYAYMGIVPGGGFRSQRRSSTGGGTSYTKASPARLSNVWVKIVRSSDTLSGYKSVDGVNWTLENSTTITMAPNIYVGWAIASGSSSGLVNAAITNVSVVP